MHGFEHTPWHSLGVEETLRRLGSDPVGGLGVGEVGRRRASHGANRLPTKPPEPAWRLLLRQFTTPLTAVLAGAAVLAGVIGDTTDMVVIAVVVLFNGGLGFYQEYRAGRLLEALQGMLAPQCAVRRGGQTQRIAAEELVPGDLVQLDAGDRVPADGRLVEAHRLEIDEAVLTGESVSVAKQTAPLDNAVLPIGDRTNCAFMNTVVTRGRGEMVVTATGAATEMGRIAALLEAAEPGQSPLQAKIDQLGKRLGLIAVVVVALILALSLVTGASFGESILTAVALAVAAIPEGLPAVVTVTLAIGMHRMTRRGAIVRRMAAVEALGSTTVICSDKTGTLTLNQMTARALWFLGRRFAVEGSGYGGEGAIIVTGARPDFMPVGAVAWLCNDARLDGGRLVGDPTEGALLALARKAVATAPTLPRIGEVPFDSESKFMASFHRDGDAVLVLVKGAPAVVMAMCSGLLEAEGEKPLDAAARERVRGAEAAMAGEALRVLALAWRRRSDAGYDQDQALQGLCLVGLVGIFDPPRPEARAAIAACRAAGIAVKMITGDHRATAAAIARDLGITGEALAGTDLDGLDDAALDDRIDGIGVVARVAPEHKVRVVKALKRRGHVVAMTGDGVNDAAALRTADIGIAMGRTGADVTREAATLVLTDDNFATIAGAVHEGRTIYDNIVKFLRFQLSTNFGALLTVVAASLGGLPVPFHAIQILWVNIIMDGPPAMALAFDPPRRGIMAEPPRPPRDPILGRRRLLRLLAYGAAMAAGTLGVFVYALDRGSIEYARTLAFTTFVLFQFFNLFNARVSGGSALGRQLFANGKLWVALGAVVALQGVAVHFPPAQAVFHTTPLGAGDWLLAVIVASSVLVAEELRKLVARLAGGARSRRGYPDPDFRGDDD